MACLQTNDNLRLRDSTDVLHSLRNVSDRIIQHTACVVYRCAEAPKRRRTFFLILCFFAVVSTIEHSKLVLVFLLEMAGDWRLKALLYFKLHDK